MANLAHLTLRYASGLIAHVHVNWISPVKVRRIMLGGRDQTVLWDDLASDEKVRIYDAGVSIESAGAIEPQDDRSAAHQLRIGYRRGGMTAQPRRCSPRPSRSWPPRATLSIA